MTLILKNIKYCNDKRKTFNVSIVFPKNREYEVGKSKLYMKVR